MQPNNKEAARSFKANSNSHSSNNISGLVYRSLNTDNELKSQSLSEVKHDDASLKCVITHEIELFEHFIRFLLVLLSTVVV